MVDLRGLGAAVGGAHGACQLILLRVAGREIDIVRAAAAVCTLLAWTLVGFVVAVASQWIAATRLGRRAGALVAAFAMGSVAFLSFSSTVFRAVSGRFLGSETVRWAMASRGEMLSAAWKAYPLGFAAIAAVSIGVGALAAVMSARSTRTAPWRPMWALALLVAALPAVYFARDGFARAVALETPLLAWLVAPAGEPRGAAQALEPPPGPPRHAEDGYRRALREAEGPRPNVLLIVLESVNRSHLGYEGYGRPTTPALDALARGGIRFERAWSTASLSSYAQMAILSSLLPHRSWEIETYERLDYPRFLFHDVLAARGYATVTISSQDESWQGMRRFETTGTPTFFWDARDFPGPYIDTGAELHAPDDATTSVALAWLERHQGAPWALYVNLQATHFPYTIPDEAPHPYAPFEPTHAGFKYLGYPEDEREVVVNRYDDALRFVDAQIGRLVAHLEASGELADTLVVVTADHGEALFSHGHMTHGTTLYETEIRVPLVFSWPGHLGVEVRVEPVSHLDVLPTVCELLGIPPHPSFQGRSVASAGATGRPVLATTQGLEFVDAAVCYPYKLVIERTTPRTSLYHLGRDPDESIDLLADEPAVGAALTELLESQLRAQRRYHARDAGALREERFQPRLLACPDWGALR